MSEPKAIPIPTGEPKKLDKWAIFGWSMFDFANSSFTTVMVTAYFSLYFQSVIVPTGADGSTERGSLLWGIANSISQILVIVSAPLVGALADFSGSKKKFLFVTYVGCSALTFMLGWVGGGQIALGMTLFILANIFYSSGENIVGAFLPEIAPQEKMGVISGMAWGLGYIGGIGSLVASLFILQSLGEETGYPWVWMMIGIWFIIAGLPTFMFVKERHQHEKMPEGQTLATVGFHRLARTLREVRRFRQLFRFLIIFMIISIGLTAVISFASIIAKETLNFNSTQLGIFLIVTNIVAVGGAWGWGWLQDKIGSRMAIILSLVSWLIALGIVVFITPSETGGEVSRLAVTGFWIAGCFVGIGMGATSSSCRALVGLFSTEDRTGEFFGLWGLFGKLGSVLGPLTFGGVRYFAGDIRVAEVVIGLFFLAGIILMPFIDEKEGRAVANGTAWGI